VVEEKVELGNCEEEAPVTKDSDGRKVPSVITVLLDVEPSASSVVQPPSVDDGTKPLDSV